MDALEIRSVLLHLETVMILIVLGYLSLSQIGRNNGSGLKSSSPYAQERLAWTALFLVTAGFSSSLWGLSPLLCFELGAVAVLGILHPTNALCLFASFLLLRPWEIAPPSADGSSQLLLGALPRALALLWAASWIMERFRTRDLSLSLDREATLLLAFSTWLFLTTFKSGSVAEAQAYWWESYFKAFTLFYMARGTLKSAKDIRCFQQTLMISIFGMALLGFTQFLLSSEDTRIDDRLRSVGLLEDPNDFAAITILALPMAAAPLFRRHAGFISKTIGAFFSLICLASVWYSRSRGALLAFLVTLGLRSVLKMKRNRTLAVLTVAGLCLSYTVMLNSFDRSEDDMSSSSSARVNYWKTGLRMAAHNPFFGVGYDQYPREYENYALTLEYEWGVRTAHSSFVLALAESGLIGGGLFLAFFGFVARSAWRIRESRPELLYSFVGYGVAMAFLSHTYLIYPYLLFGLISAARAQAERDEKSRPGLPITAEQTASTTPHGQAA